MLTTSTLAEAGQALFANYPQATRHDGGGRVMILLVPDGGDGRYFILDDRDALPSITVRRWREKGAASLGDDAPEWAADAVTRGIPLPRDGSLYGWTDNGRVTALIAFYARWTPEYPLPSWSPMPDADAADWPPFVGEHLLGPWLWEHYHAGRIVDAGPLIAASPGAVFWTTSVAPLEWGCCAVAHDLASPDGWTLPRGRYVYHGELRAGVAVPSLETLLADPSATDLAPRFQGR